jgi:hypothetical protein
MGSLYRRYEFHCSGEPGARLADLASLRNPADEGRVFDPVPRGKAAKLGEGRSCGWKVCTK